MKKTNKLVLSLIKLIIFIIMLVLFIYFGTKDYDGNISDNVLFANEYKDVSKNNIFVYQSGEEILNILNGGNGIIFLGFPDNIWSHYYAKYLNEVALEEKLDKIYYYDFVRDRTIKNVRYETIVNKLKPYLMFSDTNHYALNAPTVIVVKNGNVVYFNDEVQTIRGVINPEDYFTEYKINYLKAEFANAIKLYKGDLD